MSAAIEAIVMSAVTSETKASGMIRKVTFLLPNDGDHPFAGMVGDRLHIVCLKIADDETVGDAPTQGGEAHAVGNLDGGRPAASPPASNRPSARKAWADLPPSQQAAIRCSEREFWTFLDTKFEDQILNDEDAAATVRLYCCVKSRTELNDNQKARVLWHQLDREFLQATGRLAHG